MSFITFGEIMLRLSPKEKSTRLNSTTVLAVDYAGSESNVATSLATLGNQVQFVSKLPQNPLGEGALRSLKAHGVDTSNIKIGGERIGSYYIELGASIRPSSVVYDRKHSSFSEIEHDEFDWAAILEEKSWLFISGITPALSENCANATISLVKIAKKMGVKVAFDFNYRRTLWNDKKRARKIFDEILSNTDLLVGNAGSLTDVYGFELKGANETEIAVAGLQVAARSFGLKSAAFTIRDHVSASLNHLGGVFFTNGTIIPATNYTVSILDRFGTGDAFAAGLLHSLNLQWESKRCIEFATAAFALKHTIFGDHHSGTEQEIFSIMEGHTSGHVIR